jgi:antitoxin component of MazEF toxin-antitoxin module
MEVQSALDFRRFTSVIRENGGVSYIHIPKDLASAWGLKSGTVVELAVIRTYEKTEREKKK